MPEMIVRAVVMAEPYGSYGAGNQTRGRGGGGGGGGGGEGGVEGLPISAVIARDQEVGGGGRYTLNRQAGPSGLVDGGKIGEGRADKEQSSLGLVSKLTNRLKKTLRSVSPSRRSGAPVRVWEGRGGEGGEEEGGIR